MPLFRKVLVANRGEIAVRVLRTCRVMGIPTVAVFSEADRASRHVREADEAVAIGPAEARLSYLSIGAIVDAARRTAAAAVHPGYGFLSQSGDFADALAEAGLVFVGPPGDVHRRMGDKSAARRLMAAAGVPVLPGYDGEDQSDDRLLAEAERIGWPVMLKPSRGGGGKGMRVVRGAKGFPDALAASRREARAAFGADAMVLERFVERPRHVEVQVIADAEGSAVHFGE
ncbi:MAG TPA: biotin carboxylase N-terminal domain-containing protein, partial [Vicinamibacteria bacterium]|nr:biotin carboxylase N-terminal domain-containing protein [Vicinamibacteria bacterium]